MSMAVEISNSIARVQFYSVSLISLFALSNFIVISINLRCICSGCSDTKTGVRCKERRARGQYDRMSGFSYPRYL